MINDKSKRILSKETPEFIGKKVLLKGWVKARRDHGKLIFLDLRDKSGLVQLVVNPKVSADAHQNASEVRNEYVIEVEGNVNPRSEKQINPDLETGNVEVEVTRLSVINTSRPLPFDITSDTRAVNEEIRLKYRYLDLRNERMKKNLKLRHNVIQFIRNYLMGLDFTEIQTPILTKSTPEGARDYLVPSRIYPGNFFALPQSPQ